jgi:hypothetical protein
MRILLLVLVSFGAFAQYDKKIEKDFITTNTFLAIGDNGESVFCGYTQIKFYINNKRVILESRVGHIDLKIIERSSDIWVGVDSHNNEYYVGTMTLDGDYGFVIVPRELDKHLLGFVFNRNPKLCEK